jgi:hypothetical protein
VDTIDLDDGSNWTHEKILVDEYISAVERLEQAEQDVMGARRRLHERLGESSATLIRGDYHVIYETRRPPRKVNVAGVIAVGVPETEYCTTTPSVTKLRAYAADQGWSDEKLDSLLIETGPAYPRIGLKTIVQEEEDDDDR